MRKIVDKAVAGISWDAQLQRLNVKDSQWTLCHGDFWPGNVMWMTNEDEGCVTREKRSSSPIRFIDWEMVGVGSGPQDLGQYVISNMDPGERRQCERHLVEAYYKELMEYSRQHDEGTTALSSYTWDECWYEYRVGGFERWIWFLV